MRALCTALLCLTGATSLPAQLVVQPELGYATSSVTHGVLRTSASTVQPALALGYEGQRWLWSAGAGALLPVRELEIDVWDAWLEVQRAVWPGVRVHGGYLHTSRALPVLAATLSDDAAADELVAGLTLEPASTVLATIEAFHDVARERGTYVDFTASHHTAVLEVHDLLIGGFLQAATGASWGGSATERRFERDGMTHGALSLGLNVRQPTRGGAAVFTCQARGDSRAHRGCRLELHASYRFTGARW